MIFKKSRAVFSTLKTTPEINATRKKITERTNKTNPVVYTDIKNNDAMSQFWNERFSAKEYVYGTEPNHFYREQLEKLPPGKILFPAEGEGRNAVFAAHNGWQVTAFDPSTEARKKALNLAGEKNVEINYFLADYENINLPSASFDCMVLIYAHMPPNKREEYHQKLAALLKPDGTLILEGFSKKQINYNTGGPRNEAMLFSLQEIRSDFQSFSHLTTAEKRIELNEGIFHSGTAAVIQALGRK